MVGAMGLVQAQPTSSKDQRILLPTKGLGALSAVHEWSARQLREALSMRSVPLEAQTSAPCARKRDGLQAPTRLAERRKRPG
jgi:hypothetical protein